MTEPFLAGGFDCEDEPLELPAQLWHLSCCSFFGTCSKLAAHTPSPLTHSLPATASRRILVPHTESLFLCPLFEDNLDGNMHLPWIQELASGPGSNS